MLENTEVSGAQNSDFPAAMLLYEHDQRNCRIEDLSQWAACISSDPYPTIDEGATVALEIEGIGNVPAEVVMMPDGKIGLMFTQDTPAQLAIANWLKQKARALYFLNPEPVLH